MNDKKHARCATCHYWEHSQWPEGTKFLDGVVPEVTEGWCHRYPPLSRHKNYFPLVNSFDWCGEHSSTKLVTV